MKFLLLDTVSIGKNVTVIHPKSLTLS